MPTETTVTVAHTPGAWDLEWPTAKHAFIVNSHSATDGEDMAIAEVWSGEADARLIAAAPELLEQLKNLAQVCESVCHGWPWRYPFRDIATARALIAKAEGR